MTITYTAKVANSRLCCFTRLLFYWKGSIYKLIYKEMLIFICIYTLLSLVYRLALGEANKRLFEHIVLYCEAFTNLIPLSFIMGFYVAIVMGRWWNQFNAIPWPDRLLVYVSSFIEGADERGRILRRTLARYLSLASLIVFQAISVSVKKRFPTEEHLIEAGVMTVSEKKCMDEVNTPHGKWWAPMVWFATLTTQLRKEGRIRDDYLFKTILDEMHRFRDGLGTLYSYDWICVPLVYTQVTTLAVYTYFLGSVIGQQFLDPEQNYPGHAVDLYVPIFTLLQFFFYMGWLKVAEQLINPFGEDEDDFDMNWIIDRNFQVSLIVVDDMYGRLPTIEKDPFWEEEAPANLPYTKSALSTFTKPFMGSTADLSFNGSSAKFVDPMETIPEIHVSDSTSHCNSQSAMSSPAHTRRIHSNLLSSLKSQLIGSKSTLDNVKVYPEDVTAEPTPLSSPVNSRRLLQKNLLSRLSSQLGSSKGSLKPNNDAKYPGAASRTNVPRVHSCIEDLMDNNSAYFSEDGSLYGDEEGVGMGKPSVSSEFINRVRVNSFTRRRVEETIKAAQMQKRDGRDAAYVTPTTPTTMFPTTTPTATYPPYGPLTPNTGRDSVYVVPTTPTAAYPPHVPLTPTSAAPAPLSPLTLTPGCDASTPQETTHLGQQQEQAPLETSMATTFHVVKAEEPIISSVTSTPAESSVIKSAAAVPEVKYYNAGDGYMYEVPSSDQSTVNSLTPLLQSCQTSSEEDIAEELVAVVTVL